MVPPFDIFRVENDGQLVWRGAEQTLDLAKLRVKIFAFAQPGDYVIFSQQTSHRIVIRSDGSTAELAEEST